MPSRLASRSTASVRLGWRLPVEERNLLWWMFTDPAARTILTDWETEAAAQLARYRASGARYPDDPSFCELTDRLHAASPEVRTWWPRHEIAPLSSGTKRLRHPALGQLDLHHVVLQVTDHPRPEARHLRSHPRRPSAYRGPARKAILSVP